MGRVFDVDFKSKAKVVNLAFDYQQPCSCNICRQPAKYLISRINLIETTVEMNEFVCEEHK